MNGDFLVRTWLVQPKLNTVSSHGKTIRLEPKVMDVLVCLASSRGEPVSKEVLLNTVWAGSFVGEDVLTRSIFELRRAFGDSARNSRFIQTIPRRGYRLMTGQEPSNKNANDPALVKQGSIAAKMFFAAASLVVLLIFGLVVSRGDLSANRQVAFETAQRVQLERPTQTIATDLGKKRLLAARKVVKKSVSNLSPDLARPAQAMAAASSLTILPPDGIASPRVTAQNTQPRLALYQNIPPDVARTRLTHVVLPTYPTSALQAHVTGTVEIGVAVSPHGDVSGARVLIGHPMLITPALEAIRQWRFEPNRVQGELTWSRMRALVRFQPDGTTAVAFASPLLADSFGDPGSQRDERQDAAALPVVVPTAE